MRLLLAITVTVLLAGTAAAQVVHLNADIKKSILGGQSDSGIVKVSQIPPRALKACKFRLANPGEEFQVTDVVTDSRLLDRRLIWGAFISRYLVLHYEKGGIGHSYHLVVLSKDNRGDFTLLWNASSIRFRSYDDFRTALARRAGHAIDDSRDYSP